jgi:hypothetical protein
MGKNNMPHPSNKSLDIQNQVAYSEDNPSGHFCSYNFELLSNNEMLTLRSHSVGRIGTRNIIGGNGQMALLGDTVLKLAILTDWFYSNDMTRGLSPLPSPSPPIS